MSSPGLVTRSARGGGTVIAGSIITAIIQFTGVAILSRLIAPEDFGLIAMVAVFVTLGNLIRDFGMPMAALEARELSDQQASNLFWMNAALAASASILLAVTTPLIVVIYSETRLSAIVPIMALVILATGLGAQLQVQLARRMRYTALAATDVISQASGLIVAVIMAVIGFGYWALVGQSVVTALVLLTSRWIVTGWVPHRYRRGHGSAQMFKAGAQYGIAYFLTFLQNNADTLIIGSRLGAGPLGFYSRAYQLLSAPAGRLLTPLTQVVIPALNGARNEGRDYAPILLRVQFVIGAGMIWIFAITAGAASLIIPIVLGSGWDEAIPVFQILALGGGISSLSTVSYWGFVANQQSRELLKYNLVSKPLALACIVAGSFFGLEGVAWGYSASMAISWPINLVWLRKTARLPAGSFFAGGVHLLLAGAAGGGAAWLLTTSGFTSSNLLMVVVAVIGGTLVMLISLVATRGSRSHLAGAIAVGRRMLKKTNHEEATDDTSD